MAACSSSYSVYAEETKAEATRVEESKEEGVRCDPSWWDMNDPLAQTASDGHELASFKSQIQRLKRLCCRVREAGVIVLI